MSKISTRIGFGVGAFGKDLVYALVSGFILYYYNNVLGVSGTFLGIAMMAARVFDAVDDPIMGVVVAKTRSRWGRYRPWIFAGTLTNALLLIALFAVPPAVEGTPLLIWMAVVYLLWSFTYTLMDIPFWSMIPAITQAGSTREELVVVGRVCSALGGFIPAAFALAFVTRVGGGERAGFAIAAAIAAVVFLAAEIVTVILVRETRQSIAEIQAQRSPSIREMLTALVRNDQVLVVVVGIVIFSTSQYLTGQLAVYFFTYDIGDPDALAIFAVVGLAAQILAMLSFRVLRKRMSAKAVLTLAIGLTIAGYLMLFGFATVELHGPLELISSALVIYLGAGLMSVLTTVFIADCVDYGEWKTGQRNESIVFSMQTFVAKLASALAVLIAGIGLDVIGMNSAADEQTAATLVGLRVLMLLVPIVALVGALIFLLRKYRLDDSLLAKISADLGRTQEQPKGSEIDHERA